MASEESGGGWLGLLGPSSTAGKWLGFVTAVWVQAISGNNYTFSNYSDALKTLMGLTQLQLNTLSVAKDVGKAFGVFAGLASDHLPTPFILLIGSLLGLFGYGVQWLVVSRRLAPLPFWQMCIFLCMGGNSTTWMNTAVLVTCIRNFRKNRGPVSGILKGYIGLSTAIFTDLCSALFADSPASFLLMLSVIPAAVCLTAMLFLRESPPAKAEQEQEEESRYFGVFNAVAVVVAVYLLLFDVTGRHGTAVSRSFATGLLLLLASPLAIPIYAAAKSYRSGAGRRSDPEARIREPLLAAGPVQQEKKRVGSVGSNEKSEVGQAGRKGGPTIGEDHSIVEAFRTLDFWVMFLSFLCGVGTGLAVMNNMGQMGLALGFSDVSIFVSLISIWGFFGRIMSGSVSEYFLKSVNS